VEKSAKKLDLTFEALKPDNEKSIVTANHKTPKIVYGLTFLSLVGAGAYFVASRLFLF